MHQPFRLPSWPRLLAACICLSGVWSSAHAALTISTTRIVQTSDRQSNSVIIANPSKRPYAAQIWINTDADDTTTAVPLIASPALARLEPGSEQTVQIHRLPNNLPEDRESLFYLNVQEIPQTSDDTPNSLTIALRTRIKLFYRPSQLEGRPDDQRDTLKWSLEEIDGKPHLIVDNPTPYHYTFANLEASQGARSERIDARAMAKPMERQRYALQQLKAGAPTQLTFTIVNDYGAASEPLTQSITVAPGIAVNPAKSMKALESSL